MQGCAVFAAVVAFVLDHCAVAQFSSEFRRNGMVADIARSQPHFCRKAQQRIAHGVDLCVQTAAGGAYGFSLLAAASIGMLVNFGVGAVRVGHLLICSENEPLMQPVNKPGM